MSSTNPKHQCWKPESMPEEVAIYGGNTAALFATGQRRRHPARRIERIRSERRDRGVVGEDTERRPVEVRDLGRGLASEWRRRFLARGHQHHRRITVLNEREVDGGCPPRRPCSAGFLSSPTARRPGRRNLAATASTSSIPDARSNATSSPVAVSIAVIAAPGPASRATAGGGRSPRAGRPRQRSRWISATAPMRRSFSAVAVFGAASSR